MKQRMYAGEADLKLLQDFNATAISVTDHCGYLHPGTHFLPHLQRQQALRSHRDPDDLGGRSGGGCLANGRP